MTWRKAFERRETKLSNCEFTPHAVWPLAKSLMKWDRPNEPTTIHGPSGFKFLPSEKANVNSHCLENQFTPHDLCEKSHEWQLEAGIQALSEAMDNSLPEKAKPCDVQNLIISLRLRRACRTNGIPNKCLRHLPRRPLVMFSEN
jgi:hypothetical protein